MFNNLKGVTVDHNNALKSEEDVKARVEKLVKNAEHIDVEWH